MNILVIGEPHNAEECKAKFGNSHLYTLVPEHREAEKFLHSGNLVFDFVIDEEPGQFEVYFEKNTTAFLNTAKISLGDLTQHIQSKIKATLFGFNGLPTFLNRPLFETSLWHSSDQKLLEDICKKIATDFTVVEDRVGLVTPRIVSMIINEAYYTIQEGTSSRQDIDLAMKLGTNYPYGPFEWCERIGIRHVYELLSAVYEDTRDERYKISPLLKREYLMTV